MVVPGLGGSAVLARPRLLELMRGRFDVGAVALVAGAGFGKTTLLRQAVADNVASPRGIDVSIACSPADARTSHLGRRLALALTVDLTPADTDAPLGALCGALAENASVPTCIVLDDVHHVPPESPGGRLLRDLLGGAPENAHFVVSSREPVRGLARRRAHQQVIEIGEGALRFTNAELARIGPLQDERGRSVDLGGWPALVRLATAFGPSAAREFAREEVLDALDVDRRRALAAIVAIGGGSRELCAAVAQLVLDRPVVLDELIAGLPLIWSDDSTVEPHGLWTRLLDGVLTKEERRAVGAHAAAACRAAGDSARGFELAVAVDDVEGVRASIRTACSRGYAALPRDVLADWQDRLPDVLRSEPEGQLLAGIAERARDPFGERAREFLDRARVGFQQRGDVATEIATSSEYVFVLRARGELDRVGPVIERAFALEAEGHDVVRGTCQLARGIIAETFGDDATALEEIGRIDDGAISPEWQVAADFLMMVSAYCAGREGEVLAAARRCVAGVGASYPGHDLIVPGAEWLVGRPADVPDLLPPLPDPDEATPIDQLWAGSVASTIEACRGELDRARAAHARAADALGADTLPFLQSVVVGAGAFVAVAAGDDEAARMQLAGFVDAHEPTNPGVDRGLRLTFVVPYVLSPALRAQWDVVPLGPVLERKRAIAHALVAIFEGKPLPEGDARLTALDAVCATPPPWCARLAASLVASGRVEEGREIATAFGGVARETALDTLAELERDPDPALALGARRLRGRVAIAVGPTMTIALLGPTQLLRAGVSLDHEHWRRRRVRELLAFVAHHRQTTRDKVLGALWPDLPESAARRNLRVTLTYLQTVLEPDRVRDEPPFYLQVDQDIIRVLGPPHVQTDLRALEELVAAAEAATATGDLGGATDEYERALAVWRGDYLEEFVDSEWAGLARDSVRNYAVGSFVRAANVALGAGRNETAITAAEKTLAIEPWSEEAFRVLIAARFAAGDRVGAARAFEQCDAMLEDLGVGRSPQTEMLRRSLDAAEGSHDSRRETR